METILKQSGFCELNEAEMMDLDGGSPQTAQVVMIVGGAVIAGILAPLTCGGSLAIYFAGLATGVTSMAVGASL